jgi:glycosyltransferase involved in cell wall biosynthesis
MRILFVTTGMRTGGAEIQIAGLATELVEQGHTIALLNLTGKSEIPLPSAVSVFNLNMRSQGFVRGLWLARHWVNQWHPDVVHSHMIKANLFARLLRSISRIPRLICTAHSIREGSALMMCIYRATDRLCDLTTHVSQEAIEHFVLTKAVPKRKIRFMPNGINTQQFDLARKDRATIRQEINSEPGTFIWLHVGRLVHEKAQDLLIQAFKHVVTNAPQSLLLIAGDGPLHPQLSRLVDSLGLKGSVKLLGRRTDVPQLMQAADGFVLSSRIEGSPLVLGEAMASGLPTVSTQVSGAAQLLTPNDKLVPIGDAEALAQAMLTTMNTEATDKQRSLRRTHVESRYAMPAVARQWIQIYQAKACAPESSSG